MQQSKINCILTKFDRKQVMDVTHTPLWWHKLCLIHMPEWNLYRWLHASNIKYVVFKSSGSPDTVAVKACTSAILSWKLLDLVRKWKKQACPVMAIEETLSSFPMHFPPWQLQRLSCVSKSCCKTQQATEPHSGKVILPSWMLKTLHFKKTLLIWLLLKAPSHFRGKHKQGKQPVGEIRHSLF